MLIQNLKYRSENVHAEMVGHCTRTYWSCRPGNRYGGCTGKYWKRLTHKRERYINKKLELNALLSNG